MNPILDVRSATDQAEPALRGAPAGPDEAAGIYIHIPFCAHICPYCDFNTYAGQESLIPRYVAAVAQELDQARSLIAGRPVQSIFFGGGTPSLLSAAQIAHLIERCRIGFNLERNVEITLEANPNGLDECYLSAIRAAGIDRLSIGAQTLSRRGLRSLGRLHEPTEIGEAVRAARAAGFTNLSLDMIFGWPGQTVDQLDRDIAAVTGGLIGDSVPDHLSLYSLIVEPGTPMADAVARGIVSVPDDDAAADLYELAIMRLAAAGWQHYEIANWTRQPRFGSRHNRLYWRNGDYLGIGAGAHGHLRGERWMNHLLPRTYCEAVETQQTPRSNLEHIPANTAMGETMMLGLRLLADGVDSSRFAARHGQSLESTFGPVLHDLEGLGLLHRSAERVTLTHRGLLLANDVCARFV